MGAQATIMSFYDKETGKEVTDVGPSLYIAAIVSRYDLYAQVFPPEPVTLPRLFTG